jgi:hypothetical protein
MPITDQDQIATSLKQRTYWGDPDGVASVGKAQVIKTLGDLFPTENVTMLEGKQIAQSRINEESRTISLDVDIDEGKQFYISSINVIGHDACMTCCSSRATSMTRGSAIFSFNAMLTSCQAMPHPMPAPT